MVAIGYYSYVENIFNSDLIKNYFHIQGNAFVLSAFKTLNYNYGIMKRSVCVCVRVRVRVSGLDQNVNANPNIAKLIQKQTKTK